MRDIYMQVVEDMIEEHIARYISEGMSEADATTKAEQVVNHSDNGKVILDRMNDRLACAGDAALDALRDSQM